LQRDGRDATQSTDTGAPGAAREQRQEWSGHRYRIRHHQQHRVQPPALHCNGEEILRNRKSGGGPQAATDQSLRAILHGAPIKIIAGAASNAPFRVLAAKNIARWSDLKGKTISVGGLTDVTLYFVRVMARKNGLADHEYDLIYGGGTPSRFAQLASGAAAAAILTNPVDFTALEQGFVDLGSVPQYLPSWAQNNILVDTRWAQSSRAPILAFLRAHIKATRYLYDSTNRDEVIGILARHTHTTPQIAAATYDLYMRQQVIAREASLYPEGIKANLDALVEMGELTQAPSLAGFIDASFLAEASR
jgi:NitT/TauT family transport system substrate-binding protein